GGGAGGRRGAGESGGVGGAGRRERAVFGPTTGSPRITKASASQTPRTSQHHLHDPWNLRLRSFRLDASLAIWPYYNCHMTIATGGLYGTNPDCRCTGWSKGFEPSNLRI